MHGHFVFQRDFFFAHNLLTGVSRSTRNEKLQCFCCGLFVYLAKNRCKDQFNTSQQATFTQQEASHTLISQEIVLKKLEKYNNLIRFRFFISASSCMNSFHTCTYLVFILGKTYPYYFQLSPSTGPCLMSRNVVFLLKDTFFKSISGISSKIYKVACFSIFAKAWHAQCSYGH